MEEILDRCRPIPGFDGYFASSCGNIVSTKMKVPRILKPRKRQGYLSVSIWNDNKGNQHKIHRLVALAWLDNPLNLPDVNHKNKIRDDNRVENLEWLTKREHAAHTNKDRLTGAGSKTICQATQEGVLIAKFLSQTEASDKTGVDQQSISQVCTGKRRTAGGFLWFFEENFQENTPMRPYGKLKPIEQYTIDGDYIQTFGSATLAGDALGVNGERIAVACRKAKPYIGFEWKYEVKPEIVDETEYWATIEGYPLYRISRDGKIFSLWHKQLRKQKTDEDGYMSLSLTDEHGTEKDYLVHRVVAIAYLPNPDNLPLVNHLDGNPSNNTVENLEWATRKRNAEHALETGLTKTRKEVIQMDPAGNEITRYRSVREAAEAVNISANYISHVCRGCRKTAATYRWKYA